jgi:hypothetical protein
MIDDMKITLLIWNERVRVEKTICPKERLEMVKE